MPNTFIPIQTYTLTSSASSVTFSNIPQNYNDLQIVVSARTDRASVQDIMLLSFNGSTSSFSSRYLEGNGSSAGVYADQARGFGNACGANATASTFGNTELRISNYASSNSKSWSSDGVNETNATAAFSSLFAGLWANAAAITSITLTGNSSNFVSGSTFTLYGVSNGVKATGGTVIVAGGYAYHTFTSTGSFFPSQRIKGAEVLCVAGGGGGGGGNGDGGMGGGGGAGGVLYASSVTLNAGNIYTALIGAGGAGGTTSGIQGTNGDNSVLASLVAIGGGGGGGVTTTAGKNGGSGGGGGRGVSTAGTGVVGQGNDGGTGPTSFTANSSTGGGGGGAGAVGAKGRDTGGGEGGMGTTAYTTWHSVTSTGALINSAYYVAAGGGGGIDQNGFGSAGVGGIGGGGSGASSGAAGTGTANTGSGGGGGTYRSGGIAGGAGGSGLIIVRYPIS